MILMTCRRPTNVWVDLKVGIHINEYSLSPPPTVKLNVVTASLSEVCYFLGLSLVSGDGTLSDGPLSL